VVVLPTPPFWLAIAITFVTGASPQNLGAARTAVGEGSESCHGTPATPGSGTPVIHTLWELFTESVDIRASFCVRSGWLSWVCPCTKTADEESPAVSTNA